MKTATLLLINCIATVVKVDAGRHLSHVLKAKDEVTDGTSTTLVDASELTNIFSPGSKGSTQLLGAKAIEAGNIDDADAAVTASLLSRYTATMQSSTKKISKRRKQSILKNDIVDDADLSGEFTSRISAAFAKKNPQRGLYEDKSHRESFEPSMNIFDYTSYNYIRPESLYSSKSSKPHSDATTANQVSIYLVDEAI
jgi:hypothetical protein